MPLMPPEGIGQFRGPLTTFNSLVSGVFSIIAQPISSRVLLMISTTSATGVFIAPNSALIVNGGIRIINTLSPLIFTWQDHGPLVTAQWYGIHAGAGNQQVCVIEVFYQPQGI